jgi:hypothetical protein
MPKPQAAQAHEEKGARRLHTWKLHQMDWLQVHVAAEPGIMQGAVIQWFKRLREGDGIESLSHYPVRVRQHALADEEFAQMSAAMAIQPLAVCLRSAEFDLSSGLLLMRRCGHLPSLFPTLACSSSLNHRNFITNRMYLQIVCSGAGRVGSIR